MRIKTQVFSSKFKVLLLNPVLLKSAVQNHLLKMTCTGLPTKPAGSDLGGGT